MAGSVTDIQAPVLSPRVTAMLSCSAMAHNYRWLRTRVPKGTRLMAVVKANAYGHGAALVAPVLQQIGVDAFGVAATSEARELREAGVTIPIYILSPLLPEDAAAVLETDACPVVENSDFVFALSEEASRSGREVAVHLKVDVGLRRFGVFPECAVDSAVVLDSLPGIRITGISTHFPCADAKPELTASQWTVFEQTAQSVSERLGRQLVRHAIASAGLLSAPQASAEMVRCGLIFYGLAPSGHDPWQLGLEPVLSLHTRVLSLRRVPPGTAVGYGGTFVTQRHTLVATAPVGYGDGYARALGNRAQVLLRGRRVPVIGRVCMDQMMIDATDTGAEIGDVVTVIGGQGCEKITVNEIAKWLDTIPHEVTTLLSARVQRVLVP